MLAQMPVGRNGYGAGPGGALGESRGWSGWALALLIGAAVIGLRAPLMDLPLERDEGGYAYVAWRLDHGELPYRDWFEQKPPGIFLIYRLSLSLPLDPIIAIRFSAAVFSALASIALFHLVRPLFGLGAAVLAACLLGLLSADPMIQGPIANTELFMLPGLIAATALLLRVTDDHPVRSSIAIGLLLGIAIAFKPVAAVNAPFLLLVFALREGRADRWRRLARFALWVGVGGMLAWGPLIAWLWIRGALAEAIDVVLLHNLRYAAELPVEVRLAALSHYAQTLLPSQGPAWAMAGLGLAALRGARFPASLLAGFALVNAVGVSASGLFFPHYFQQLLPAVAALAAAAAFGAPTRPGAWGRLRAVGVAALSCGPLLAAQQEFWRLRPDEAIQRIYPGNPFEVMPAIAREIAALADPDDRVFIFGADPEILFYARRVSASRYIYLYPLFGAYPGVEERQRELAREVSEADPAVIAWMPIAMAGEDGGFLEQWFTRFAAERYRPHAAVVADGASRGELVRIGEGVGPEAFQARDPWAMLFVRARDR